MNNKLQEINTVCEEQQEESGGVYNVTVDSTQANLTKAEENKIIANAIEILRQRLAKPGEALTSPSAVKDMLALKLAGELSEKFSVLLLNNQHRVLSFETLFHGTIDGAAVYPREVVRLCLERNAAAIILAHNHPSGESEPSQADIQITKRLKEALDLIGVRVLDHIIVGGSVNMQITSMAERGMI